MESRAATHRRQAAITSRLTSGHKRRRGVGRGENGERHVPVTDPSAA